jgi:hypothetical protein
LKNSVFGPIFECVVGVESKIKHYLNHLTKFSNFATEQKIVGLSRSYQHFDFQFLKIQFLKFESFERILTKFEDSQMQDRLKLRTMCKNGAARISITWEN